MTAISLGTPPAPPQPLAPRRKSRQIMVGSVPVGGGAPISVQTMTNTPTSDVRATVDDDRARGAMGEEEVAAVRAKLQAL